MRSRAQFGRFPKKAVNRRPDADAMPGETGGFPEQKRDDGFAGAVRERPSRKKRALHEAPLRSPFRFDVGVAYHATRIVKTKRQGRIVCDPYNAIAFCVAGQARWPVGQPRGEAGATGASRRRPGIHGLFQQPLIGRNRSPASFRRKPESIFKQNDNTSAFHLPVLGANQSENKKTRRNKWIPSNPHSSIGFDLPPRSAPTPE